MSLEVRGIKSVVIWAITIFVPFFLGSFQSIASVRDTDAYQLGLILWVMAGHSLALKVREREFIKRR